MARQRHGSFARLFSSSYQPHHRRRRHHVTRHRGRRYGHNPPDFAAILSHPADVIVPGLVATGAAIGVVTVGNYIANTFLVSFTGSFTGVTGIVARAAVRGAVAYGGDFLVKGGKYQNAYRTGVVVGIIGSAVLDFMGKSFTLGAGDTAQTPQSILGLAGAGVYLQRGPRALAGADGAGAYLRTKLMGVGNRGPAHSAMERIYGS